MRVALPVDELSYALGLFTTIPSRIYFLASALGILPGAFVFSYVGELSVAYQIIALLAGLVIVVSMGYYAKKHLV